MKKFFKYTIIFSISLFLLLFSYNLFFGDSIANLGFSYALVRGEIPYNDFNMILPLFSPFLYAIPLLIYNSSITFYATQALLLTIFYYLIEKKLGYKTYLYFFLILFSYPLSIVSGLFPGYNFILFLLIFILSYIDKDKSNDYLIGLLIGLSIITKHTVGVFLIIPSLIYYYKNINKLLKRLVGLLIPCFIFLLYLLITKSLYNFINLCVLGIFDFAKSNTSNSSLLLIILCLLLIGYYMHLFRKDKSISNLYLFLTILFIIPLFDIYHMSYFIMATLFIFMNRVNINKNIKIPSFILLITIISMWTIITFNYSDYKFINYNKYPFRYSSTSMIRDYNYVDRIYKKYNGNVNLLLLGTENYFYKITNNLDITYYDLTNYGNYGYDSYNMMKKRIKSDRGKYFIISMAALKNNSYNQQYYKELANYIIENGKFIEKNKDYSVYYLEIEK